jgi:periplasmic protein TonB
MRFERAPTRLQGPGLVSFALHGLVLLALLWPALRPALISAPPPSPPDSPQATLQIEYVNQVAHQKGAPPTTTTTNPATAAATPAPPAPPPPPPAPDGLLPQRPPPAPAAQAAAPPTPAPQPEPNVNLGDSDEDRDPLRDSGDNVVALGPDVRYRNQPPGYPRDAARNHQGGTVTLLIHVTPEGTAGLIEVMNSSGVDSLDNAARDAVSTWHFPPAEQNGVKIASVYPINIRFNAGDH